MDQKARITSLVTYGLLAITAAVALVLPKTFGIKSASAVPVPRESGSSGKSVSDTIELTGVIRDFKEWNVTGGHIDFDLDVRGSAYVGCATGQFCGLVGDTLGADGKPVFTGPGFQVKTQWKDKDGHPICYTLYNAGKGDTVGTKGCDGGGIKSKASFSQWYTDTPGVNVSSPLALTFNKQSDGSYVFDDKTDPKYSSLGGFFPIDGKLFGNPPVKKGVDHNFHFTFELHTTFKYHADQKQTFKFVGDDDVWVFINGKKVIDIGGIHGATEQYVSLDRLGLEDGKTYTLDGFFAERNRVASNFRIVTNLKLESSDVPATTDSFD